MSTSGFSIVVAMDRKRGIGFKGDLPWPKLKGDMKFFRELTTCPDRAAVEKRWGLKAEESADVQTWEDVSNMLKFAHPLPKVLEEEKNWVMMGRKTFESLPMEFRPLPQRENAYLSRGEDFFVQSSDGHFFGYLDLDHPLDDATDKGSKEVFVIGGGQIYSLALKHDACTRLYITEIDAEFPCDTFFPETPDFRPVRSSPWIDEGGVRYRFRRYDRIR